MHRSTTWLPRALGVLAAAASAAALAACGGGSAPATTTTSSTTTTAPSTVQNLAVTPAIRSALIAAGAASHHLTASDYTGLAPGETFYAYDPSDQLYWAGAALVPSAHSQAAQIATQDDGGYDLFTKSAGSSTWTAYNDGLGTVPHATCSIRTPPAVRTAWGWSLTTPCGGPRG